MEIKVIRIEIKSDEDFRTALEFKTELEKRQKKSKFKIMRKLKKNLMPELFCEIEKGNIMFIYPDMLRDLTQAKAFLNLGIVNFWNTTLSKQLTKYYQKEVFPESKVSLIEIDEKVLDNEGLGDNDNN